MKSELSPEEKQELINLTRKGEVESIRGFFSRHGRTDLNWVNRGSEVSPLMVASMNGHSAVIQLLIEEGADVNFWNSWRESALIKAVDVGKVNAIKLLMQHGATITNYCGDGQSTPISALAVACKTGDVAVVRALLPLGAQTAVQPKEGAQVERFEWSRFSCSYVACPVNIAVKHQRVELVKWFLEGGAEVPFGALFLAIKCRNNDLVEVLLKHADVNATGDGGWSALMLSSWIGLVEIMRLLLDHGAVVDLQDDRGMHALLHAAKAREYEAIQLLLEKGADSNLISDEGELASNIILRDDYVSYCVLLCIHYNLIIENPTP